MCSVPHCVGVSQILSIVHAQIFCMEIKDPKDTAMIDVNIEPAYVGKPFSTLLADPAYPQLPGESCFLLRHQTSYSDSSYS
jgi:hypothetical protein